MSDVKTPSAPGVRQSLALRLWVGIIAPILFATVFTIDGALTPGYSAYNEAISYLDLGTYGWIQRANFIVFGLLLMAFTVGYVKHMRSILEGRWLYTIASLFVLSDLGWIMGGLFVPNPYLAPQNSGHALLHQVASIIVFLPCRSRAFGPGYQAHHDPRLAMAHLRGVLLSPWPYSGSFSHRNDRLFYQPWDWREC
jgi:Protein of unknown function (DUF998)